jgi:radical SAM protein with 4Fe4S-binding SPASM domain
MKLMQELNNRAQALGVPLSVHIDLTYRCNERCVHCYLDHEDHGEMNTAEIKDVLDQLAVAGVFFLVFSGGEIFMRRDFFELAEYARSLMFCVKLKTNAFMIGEQEADRLASLHLDSVQVSIYSHRPEVHDAITKLPRSLERSIAGIRRLRERGIKVILANVLMRQNLQDYPGVKALAQELGAEYTIDPTVTPMMNGDRTTTQLGIGSEDLERVFRNPELVGNVNEFCAPPPAVDDDVLDELPCSAGHTMCYVSPYGDVYPCVQFPLPTGNLRKQKFLEIWRHSTQMNEVRSIRARDLPVCSTCSHVGTCTRCPGLAYMEGNMRGPSSQDCEKSYARTGIPSAEYIRKSSAAAPPAGLIQIAGIR